MISTRLLLVLLLVLRFALRFALCLYVTVGESGGGSTIYSSEREGRAGRKSSSCSCRPQALRYLPFRLHSEWAVERGAAAAAAVGRRELTAAAAAAGRRMLTAAAAAGGRTKLSLALFAAYSVYCRG